MVYHATLCTLNVHYSLSYSSYICHPDDDNQMVMVMIIRLFCRGGSEAPQEATILQLSEELAYVHQAYALCQAMRDRLAASMVFMILSLHAERKLCLVKTTMHSSYPLNQVQPASLGSHVAPRAGPHAGDGHQFVAGGILHQQNEAGMHVLNCGACLSLLVTDATCHS